MLNSPLLVCIRQIDSLVNDLSVDVATHLGKVCHEFYELVLVFGELLNGGLLGVMFVHAVDGQVMLQYSIEVGFGCFDEVFHEVQQKVESIYINFLQVDSHLVNTGILELFLDKIHLFIAFTRNVA